MTNPRDLYINMLEKQAEDTQDTPTDNEAVAIGEFDANKVDQKAQLTGIFDHTADSINDSNKLKKEFPVAAKAKDTSSSSSLIKVAVNEAFFNGLRDTDLLKTATPAYIKIAYDSFMEELQKIAKTINLSLDDVSAARAEGLKHTPTPPMSRGAKVGRFGGGKGGALKNLLKMASFFSRTPGAASKFMQGTLGKAQKARRATPPPIPARALGNKARRAVPPPILSR